MFDMNYKQFFGKTWRGPKKNFRQSSGSGMLEYNESIYFCTTIKSEHILIVIELAAHSKTVPISCGWGALRPFGSSNRLDATEQR
jgi:hypothetical protein